MKAIARRTPRRDALRIVLALAALPGVAHAQSAASPAPEASDDAEAMLRQGVDLRRQGNDAGALDAFRRAYEAGHSPIALAQMGLAEQALGRWLDAERHVRDALATNDTWIEHNRPEIQSAYDVIARHVGTIEVLGGVDGAQVRLDGQLVGTLPLNEPVRAVAGTATLEVRAPGYYPITRSIAVTAGQPTRESIELRAIPPGGSTQVVVAGGTGGWQIQRALGIVAAGVGVLLLAGGVASLAVRESVVNEYNHDARCPGTDSATQPTTCLGLLTEGNTERALGITGLVSGAVFAIGGALLFATAHPPTVVAPRHARGWSCAIGGPGDIGVACAFRY